MSGLKFAIIIPARYASSRFPGKPLAKLGGIPVIERVYRQARQACDNVYVATDDNRIRETVENFGGKVIMTSPSHMSGTDRICEAVNKICEKTDVVINIQGDEPFIRPEQIKLLMECFNTPVTQIATLAKKFDKSKGFQALFDPSLVKVTFNAKGDAMYFSRSIIPYVRDYRWEEWLDHADFYTHIGMYGYRKQILDEICRLPKGGYETAESLEQLRWLQSGYTVKVAITEFETIGIDTPEDLRNAEKFLQTKD